MKISILFLVAMGFVCLTPVLPCSGQHSTAQKKVPTEQQEPTRQRKRTSQEDRTQPELGEYEMTWQALSTHDRVELEISNREISVKKSFENGEQPFFNAIEENLKPGIYRYRIEFVPNELAEIRERARSSVTRMLELKKARNVAYQAGDREEAKRLYHELVELHDQALEQANGIRSRTFKGLSKQGQIQVEKDGTIKKYDRKKFSEEQLKNYLEKMARNPPREKNQRGESYDH